MSKITKFKICIHYSIQTVDNCVHSYQKLCTSLIFMSLFYFTLAKISLSIQVYTNFLVKISYFLAFLS